MASNIPGPGLEGQLGVESNGYPEFDGKAVEVVARKANVSAKTFERAKKIIEEGTEEQKVWVPKERFYFSKLNHELKTSPEEFREQD